MTKFKLPALGFMFWTILILLFDRHDADFYLMTFAMSAIATLMFSRIIMGKKPS